jgi:hypothetical protein
MHDSGASLVILRHLTINLPKTRLPLYLIARYTTRQTALRPILITTHMYDALH